MMHKDRFTQKCEEIINKIDNLQIEYTSINDKNKEIIAGIKDFKKALHILGNNPTFKNELLRFEKQKEKLDQTFIKFRKLIDKECIQIKRDLESLCKLDLDVPQKVCSAVNFFVALLLTQFKSIEEAFSSDKSTSVREQITDFIETLTHDNKPNNPYHEILLQSLQNATSSKIENISKKLDVADLLNYDEDSIEEAFSSIADRFIEQLKKLKGADNRPLRQFAFVNKSKVSNHIVNFTIEFDKKENIVDFFYFDSQGLQCTWHEFKHNKYNNIIDSKLDVMSKAGDCIKFIIEKHLECDHPIESDDVKRLTEVEIIDFDIRIKELKQKLGDKFKLSSPDAIFDN